MEIVTTYKASDGKTFEKAHKCLAHEATTEALQAGLDDFLQKRSLSDDEVSMLRAAILDWETHKQTRTHTESALDVLNLPVRTHCILREHNIRTLESLTRLTETALLRIPGIGRKALNGIKESLVHQGKSLSK